MTTDLRALLNEVAAGRLEPSRAAELLDELPETAPEESAAPRSATAPSSPAAPTAATDGSTAGVERVRVNASARPVRIVGDPTVATVSVEGPHSVTAVGTTLRVDASAASSPATPPGSYAFERKTGLSRWLAQATSVGVPLTVRMNPALVADAEVVAGSLELVGLAGPISFSVTAGSLRLHECVGPVNGVVRAGSAVLQLRPTAGASVVRVESGSVDLRLLPGSDVRVSGRADLGEFKVRGADDVLQLQKSDRLPELVIGAGTATLELQLAMGSAKVRLP